MMLAKVTGAFVLLSLTSAVEQDQKSAQGEPRHVDAAAMDLDDRPAPADLSGNMIKVIFRGHMSQAEYKATPTTPAELDTLPFTYMPIELAMQSVLMHDMTKDLDLSEEGPVIEWTPEALFAGRPLPVRALLPVQMDPNTFHWVQKYMEIHHNNAAEDIEKPVRTQDMVAIVGARDAGFIEQVMAAGQRIVDGQERGTTLRDGEVPDNMCLLFRLMEAANFLSMKAGPEPAPGAEDTRHLTLMNLLIAKVVTVMDTVEKDDDGTIPAKAMARFGLPMEGPMGPFTAAELIDIRRQGGHAPILQTAELTGNAQVIAAAKTVVDPLYPADAPYVPGVDPAPQAPAEEAAARPAAAGAAGEEAGVEAP